MPVRISVTADVFYANNAPGVIKEFRQRGWITLDLTEHKGIVTDRSGDALSEKDIDEKANRLAATGDVGNGMSERQDFYVDDPIDARAR
jgi:hypothetical protein